MNGTETNDTLDVVMFSAGEWRIGFEARRVRAARPVEANAANTQDVKNLEVLLGLPPASSPFISPQWLGRIRYGISPLRR
jgi:hypothetical protein